MIPEIDFLPKSYHKAQMRQQKRTWNRFIVVAFLALVGLGAFAQWRIESKLEDERDKVLAQADRLASSLRNADDLKKQIGQLDLQGDFVTQLSMQTRLTPLLETLSAARPRYVRLLEVQSKYEKLEVIQSLSKRKTKKKDAKKKDVDPFKEDLERIRTETGEMAMIVTLRGVAPDDLAVSQFLAGLQETAFFDSIILLYSDEYQFSEYKLRSFGMRLRLRPLGEMPEAESEKAPRIASLRSTP